MDAQQEFKARMERDVARALRHISESGGDVAALDGTVMLHIQDGKLITVQFFVADAATEADDADADAEMEQPKRIRRAKS